MEGRFQTFTLRNLRLVSKMSFDSIMKGEKKKKKKLRVGVRVEFTKCIVFKDLV